MLFGAVRFVNNSKLSWIVGLRKTYTCFVVRNTCVPLRSMSSDAAESDSEEDIIDKLRDVSRIPARYSCYMDHRAKAPPIDERFYFMKTKDYQRQLYAKFGKESGINPGLMWPSKEELAEIKAIEAEWEPSLEDMMKEMNTRKQEEAEGRRKKLEHVERQMARMPRYIDEFLGKKQKLKDQEDKQDAKRKELLEEARDFYGYYVDHRSDKFKNLVVAKQEEEKRKRKQLKKEQKEANLAKGFV